MRTDEYRKPTSSGASFPTEIKTICRSDPRYPVSLCVYLGDRTPELIYARGNLAVIQQNTLALFCSEKCPGNLILKTYDLARQLRYAGVTVISGFHSPMEKECLSLLLRGRQPVIWCPAKRLIAKRMQKEYADPLSDGKLLILTPFGQEVARATEVTACFRNEFVAALADRIFIAHAAADGRTEEFSRKVFRWRKPLLTFGSQENASLLALGARSYTTITEIKL